jgi:hypothetical protein
VEKQENDLHEPAFVLGFSLQGLKTVSTSRLKPAQSNLVCQPPHQLKLVANGESAEAD